MTNATQQITVNVLGAEYRARVVTDGRVFESATIAGTNVAVNSPAHHAICEMMGLNIAPVTNQDMARAAQKRSMDI